MLGKNAEIKPKNGEFMESAFMKGRISEKELLGIPTEPNTIRAIVFFLLSQM